MYRHYTYRLLIGCPSVTQHHPMISTPIAPWNALLLPRRKLAWRRPRRGWRLAISGPVPQFPVESTSLKFNMASPKNHPLAKGDSCYFLLETHDFQVPAEKLQGVLLPVELELFQFGIQKKMSLRKGVTLHRTFGRLQLFFHAVFVFTTLVDPHWSTWIRWKNHGWIFESVKKLGAFLQKSLQHGPISMWCCWNQRPQWRLQRSTRPIIVLQWIGRGWLGSNLPNRIPSWTKMGITWGGGVSN